MGGKRTIACEGKALGGKWGKLRMQFLGLEHRMQ